MTEFEMVDSHYLNHECFGFTVNSFFSEFEFPVISHFLFHHFRGFTKMSTGKSERKRK